MRSISDSTGAVVGSMRYSPFGRIESATGALAAMGYTGEPQDSLVYLRARYYHPALGRFLTADSIVPDVRNGQDWNAYAYVRNNPVRWVDPSGHDPDPPIDWCQAPGVCPTNGSTGQSLGDMVGERLQQGWDSTRKGVQAWWDTPSCDCSRGQPNTDAFTGLSALGSVGLGMSTTPFESISTFMVEKRTRFFSILRGSWETIEHRVGPADAMQSYRPAHGPGVTTITQKAGLLRKIDTRTTFRTQTTMVRGFNGFASGLAFGVALDAGLQLWQDSERCLTGKERMTNAGVAALTSLGAGLVGAALFGIVVAAAPVVGVSAGVAGGVATVVGISATIVAGNAGPLADWKNNNLRR